MEIRRTPQRERLVRDLLVNGPVFDKEGRATVKMWKRLGSNASAHNVSGFLRDAEKDGLIERMMNQRRTYKIALKHNPWPDLEDKALEELENGHEEVEETEPEPAFDAEAVAAKLLELVIQRATSTSKEAMFQTRISELEHTLQTEIDGREKFRQLLRDSQDELRVKNLECEGLRKNINTLGFQLDQVLKAQRSAQRIALDEGATKLLKALMSAPGAHNHE